MELHDQDDVAGAGGSDGSGDEPLPFGLNHRQKSWCDAYLSNGFDGTAAAHAVGYKGANVSVTASKLKRNPKVVLYIEMRMREQAAGSAEVLSAAETLKQLSQEARFAKSDASRVAALGLLARHHALLIDRTELTAGEKMPSRAIVAGIRDAMAAAFGEDEARQIASKFAAAMGLSEEDDAAVH